MAVDTFALTSLANLKTFLDISSSADDTLLEDCIDRASDMIETMADRKFKQRTYYEWTMPSGERTFTLDNFPIISMNTVSYGTQITFTVESDTASTDVLATVSNNGTKLRLHKINAAGSSSTSELAYSSYPTTTQLVNQINSSVSGWSATLTENAYSYSLHRFGGRGVIDAPCNLEYPSDNVSDYRVEYDIGLVHLKADAFPSVFSGDAHINRFPSGFFPVYVEYDAGYATIPDNLEQIALELAADIFNGRTNDRGMQSEAIGSYNYTRADAEKVIGDRLRYLDAFREIR